MHLLKYCEGKRHAAFWHSWLLKKRRNCGGTGKRERQSFFLSFCSASHQTIHTRFKVQLGVVSYELCLGHNYRSLGLYVPSLSVLSLSQKTKVLQITRWSSSLPSRWDTGPLLLKTSAGTLNWKGGLGEDAAKPRAWMISLERTTLFESPPFALQSLWSSQLQAQVNRWLKLIYIFTINTARHAAGVNPDGTVSRVLILLFFSMCLHLFVVSLDPQHCREPGLWQPHEWK